MKEKQFAIKDIKDLIDMPGYCLATDMIMCDGLGVGYLYREHPDDDADSGWRFLAGQEDQEYLDNPDNCGVYSINEVANYSPEIIPLLDSPRGSAFVRAEDGRYISVDFPLQQIDSATVERFLTILKENRRSAICFRFADSDGPVAIGKTKYGGQPDVAEGFNWPLDDEGRPLSFLFQMNCADIQPYDEEDLLPKDGLLSFYFQPNDDIDWDHLEHYMRVLFCSAPSGSLYRADFPDSLPEEYRAVEYCVEAYRKDSYPGFEDFLDSNLNDGSFTLEQWDDYNVARRELEPDFEDEGSDWIVTSLGYAKLLQGSIVDSFKSHVLLAQIASDENHPGGFMFGDCGTLFFYISRKDLLARRFDRIIFDMQCY